MPQNLNPRKLRKSIAFKFSRKSMNISITQVSSHGVIATFYLGFDEN